MTVEHRAPRGRWWTRPRDLPLLAEALLELARAVLILKRKPFAEVAQRLTRAASPQQSAAHVLFPMRARWAVLTVSRYLPWRSVCFDQAVAAHEMLRRRGIPADLVYGVRSSQQGLDAHVWLRLADGRIVLGGETAPLFQSIALFRPGRDDVRPPAG
jgi:Transglutaminase-like superfamily